MTFNPYITKHKQRKLIFATMKGIILFTLSISLFCLVNTCAAQDTLPKFSIRDIGKDKILISWTNPYPNCVQLSVQRSFDSTRYFSTIYSAVTPNLPENGFTDSKMPAGIKAYYRIFYVLEGGTYFFSKSMAQGSKLANTTVDYDMGNIPTPTTDSKKIIRIYKTNKNHLLTQLDYKNYRLFKDSIINKTKDSLYILSADEILLKPFMAKGYYKSSVYIYTNNKNHINIHLPDVKLHKYRIVFFEEDGSELFEIKQVKEPELVLDYANFVHAGWFSFELYEDDKLKEKNKFYLQKQF